MVSRKREVRNREVRIRFVSERIRIEVRIGARLQACRQSTAIWIAFRRCHVALKPANADFNCSITTRKITQVSYGTSSLASPDRALSLPR
jgi:hypothetical protein